jgi:hypothetical protein
MQGAARPGGTSVAGEVIEVELLKGPHHGRRGSHLEGHDVSSAT